MNSVFNKLILLVNIKVKNTNLNYKFISESLIYCSDSGYKQKISNSFRNNIYINFLEKETLIKSNFIHYFEGTLKQEMLNHIQKNNFITNTDSKQNNNNNQSNNDDISNDNAIV